MLNKVFFFCIMILGILGYIKYKMAKIKSENGISLVKIFYSRSEIEKFFLLNLHIICDKKN